MYYITKSDYLGRKWCDTFISIHSDKRETKSICNKLNEEYRKKRPRIKYDRYYMHALDSNSLQYLPLVVDELFKMILELKK